jgi:hypothetical protein
MKKVTNIRVVQYLGSFLSSLANVSFWRTRLHGVEIFIFIKHRHMMDKFLSTE